MKTRSGFVSNSSSSSFILYGIYDPDKDLLAEALWDHCGADAFKEDDIESVDDLKEAINDDPWYVESIKGSPVELMHYDEYYLGVSLGITRETLLNGCFTKGELDELDAFLKKVAPKSTPDVHEGDYYCQSFALLMWGY